MRLTRSQQTTEIDARIAAHAIHALKDAQPSRTTIPDDLLPTERVQLQEHPEIKLVEYETTLFGQLTRKFKQQKSGETATATATTTFVIGDTVEIKSATKVPLVAVIVSLHKVSLRQGLGLGGTREDDEEEDGLLLSEWKATVHRFELAGSTRVNRKARPHEPVSGFSQSAVSIPKRPECYTLLERSLLPRQRCPPHRRLFHSQPL
jgi:hypothetical protein